MGEQAQRAPDTITMKTNERGLKIINESEELARLVISIQLHKELPTGKLEDVVLTLNYFVQLFLDCEEKVFLLQGKVASILQDNKLDFHTFSKVADMYSLKEITWIKISGLYSLCVKIAVFCQQNNKEHLINEIPSLVRSYFTKNTEIMKFITQKGGWRNIVRQHPMKSKVQTDISRCLIKISHCIGLLVIFIFLRA